VHLRWCLICGHVGCCDSSKNKLEPLSESSKSAIRSFEHENHRAFSPRVIWLTGIFLGSRVLGTDMKLELLVALLFVVHLHVVK